MMGREGAASGAGAAAAAGRWLAGRPPRRSCLQGGSEGKGQGGQDGQWPSCDARGGAHSSKTASASLPTTPQRALLGSGAAAGGHQGLVRVGLVQQRLLVAGRLVLAGGRQVSGLLGMGRAGEGGNNSSLAVGSGSGSRRRRAAGRSDAQLCSSPKPPCPSPPLPWLTRMETFLAGRPPAAPRCMPPAAGRPLPSPRSAEPPPAPPEGGSVLPASCAATCGWREGDKCESQCKACLSLGCCKRRLPQACPLILSFTEHAGKHAHPKPARLGDALQQVGLVGQVGLQRLDVLLRRCQLSRLLRQRTLLALHAVGRQRASEYDALARSQE